MKALCIKIIGKLNHLFYLSPISGWQVLCFQCNCPSPTPIHDEWNWFLVSTSALLYNVVYISLKLPEQKCKNALPLRGYTRLLCSMFPSACLNSGIFYMFTETSEWNRMLTVDIILFQPIKTKETCYSWSVFWKSLIFMAELLNSHDWWSYLTLRL